MAEQQSTKKTTGRAPKSAEPSFPKDEVERLLVHGETVEREDGKGTTVRYPSYRELGNRYGVAHSLIAAFSKKHNCLTRRKQTKQRVQKLANTKLIELRASELAVNRDDQIRAIDRFLVGFEEAVEEGRVRMDNPADYNTLSRLKAFLLGDADSRQEVLNGMPSLEDLQDRHEAALKAWRESNPAMRGELPLRLVPTTEENADAEQEADADDLS